MAMQLPTVTSDDLRNFHAKHFASAPLPTEFFQQTEVEANAEESYDYYEDDGLGYYEDGVKRTLTDEQIALFRHTEIQTILRERSRKQEAEVELQAQSTSKQILDTTSPVAINPQAAEHPKHESLSDTLEAPEPSPTASPPSNNSAQNPSKCGNEKGVQSGRIERQSQWKTSNDRQKRKNAKNRRVNRKLRNQERKRRRDGSMISGQTEEDEESDEWDPWHQANGPDVQKDTSIDLNY